MATLCKFPYMIGCSWSCDFLIKLTTPPLLDPNLPILLFCLSPSQPERFVKLGIDPPKGVLLFGPPGTGKTLLARAVANRTDACFIRVIGSELVQKYVGEVRKGHLKDLTFGRGPRLFLIVCDEKGPHFTEEGRSKCYAKSPTKLCAHRKHMHQGFIQYTGIPPPPPPPPPPKKKL